LLEISNYVLLTQTYLGKEESKKKSQLTLCPSSKPREGAQEMYLLTYLVM